MRSRDRLLPASIFLGGILLHWFEGRFVPVPWSMPDELRFADGSRSLVHAGRDGSRTLYSLVFAPLWAGGTGSGYALVKLAGAVAISAAAFPVYALARRAAGPWWSAAAAALAVAAPATLYASAVRPLALAYPLVAAGVYWLTARSRRAIACGVAALGLSAAAWPAALYVVVPVLFAAACAGLGRRLLAWPGAALLAAAPAAFYSAYAIAHGASPRFAAATADWGGVWSRGAASAGAFAVGLGVVPAIAAAARPGPLLAAAAPFAVFGAGVEAYGRGAGRAVDDAVLALLLPLVAAAAVSAPRRLLAPALALAGALALAAVVPRSLTDGFDAAAPSLALADLTGLSAVALGVLVAGLAAAAGASVLLLLGKERGVVRAPAAIAVVALAAALAAEIAGASDARRLALAQRSTLPDPPSLPSGLVHDAPVAVAAAPGDVAQLLFWNPRAEPVDPPLEERAVDPATGTLDPPLDAGRLLFDTQGRRVTGTIVARTPSGTLVRPSDPVRVLETVEGLYPDGWSGAHAVYRRFDAPKPAKLHLVISREGWGGPAVPNRVDVSIGPLGTTPGHVVTEHPAPGERVETELPTPAVPFEVVVDSQTFRPSDYGQGDTRALGVQLSFEYEGGS